jgi:hypothetical protein
MAELVSENVSNEQVIMTCLVCGHKDTDEYCSKCGSKLEFLRQKPSSAFRNLANTITEYFREVSDPIFAYLKTNWLLLFDPVRFFHTLYFQDRPIGDLPFLLESL